MSKKCRVAKCANNENRCNVAGMSLSFRFGLYDRKNQKRLNFSLMVQYELRFNGPIRIKFGMSILCVHTNNHAKFQIFWFIFNKVMMILKSMCKFGLFVKILLIIC